MKLRILVQKYGGSSVKDTDCIKRVAARLIRARNEGYGVIAVVSAMGDTTDELIAKARQLTSRPPRRELDMLLSTGEQISIALLAMAVDSMGYPVVSLTGSQVGIRTDDVHTKARIRHVDTARLREELDAGRIVIVAGFQGITNHNDITTLGRGGSDTTAVALAAAVNAEVCEIHTDVDGVYTADPRVVKDARMLRDIAFTEMLEMASLGAAVLQPRSVEYAAMHGVRIHVRNSHNDNPGTLVQEERCMEKDMLVVGVAHDTNVAKVAMLNVPDRPGVAHRIFSRLANEGINVDMIVQTNRAQHVTDLVFSTTADDAALVKEITESLAQELGAGEVLMSVSVGKVSIVGAGMVSNPGVAARMFEALAEENINIQVISTSEIKVSCLIDVEDVERAVRALHAKFELTD